MPGRRRKPIRDAADEAAETFDVFEDVGDELLKLIQELRGNGLTIELELSGLPPIFKQLLGGKPKIRIRVPKS